MGYRLLVLSLLAVSLAYLAQARSIPLDAWSAEELVNSRTLPTVYGSLLALVLLALAFRPVPHVRFPRHGARAAALIVVSAAFVWLLVHLGVWLALAVLLTSAFLIMGERRPVPVLGLGLGIPALGWLTVEHLLGIYVPGPWS